MALIRNHPSFREDLMRFVMNTHFSGINVGHWHIVLIQFCKGRESPLWFLFIQAAFQYENTGFNVVQCNAFSFVQCEKKCSLISQNRSFALSDITSSELRKP